MELCNKLDVGGSDHGLFYWPFSEFVWKLKERPQKDDNPEHFFLWARFELDTT
jgi:hypothetical protein